MENNWYIQYNGTQVGPMSKYDLLSYGLNPNSMVWNQNLPAWQPAYMVPELMKIINQPGPTPLLDTAPGARNRSGGYLRAIVRKLRRSVLLLRQNTCRTDHDRP